MTIEITATLSSSDAVKTNERINRVLAHIREIHAVVQPSRPMSPELVALRRELRDLQDMVQDLHSDAFRR